MIFHLLDRWDVPKSVLHVLSASYSEEINGEDTLVVETTEELAKGDRILWQDNLDVWHESVVDSVDKTHSDGRPTSKASCVNSLVELWNDYIDYLELDWRELGTSPLPASTMLQRLLAYTRWQLGSGTIDKTGATAIYHASAREGLQAIQEAVGGEVKTTITVGTGNVVRRQVTLVDALGDQQSPKRFTWSKDIETISRKVESRDCISQLYVYGKSESTDSRGFNRRVSIDSVNQGKKYLESAAARDLWGRPDGQGGKAHSTGYVEFNEIEDPTELLAAGRKEFEARQVPQLSYTLNVIDLASMGFSYEGVGIGDKVAIVDTGFEPELRAVGRVTRIDRDLLNSDATITIGNITENVAGIIGKMATKVSGLNRRSASWDLITASDASYLEQLRGAINGMFDRNSNYQYESFELGNLWSNVPCDGDTFKPIQPLPAGVTPWAMNISSAGFRIASSLNSNGTWKWSTFGTGEGFIADAITAGVLQSAAYRSTGQGDHWILGRNGYLETYSSKFHQSDITNADITNADIVNADIVNGTIDDADITNGTIDDAAITNGTIDNAAITNSSMVNADVSGKFTTSDGSYSVKLQDAMMEGYYANTKTGQIDYAMTYTDAEGNTRHGLRLFAKEGLFITAPRLSVAVSSSAGVTHHRTKTVELSAKVVSDIGNDGTVYYKILQLDFTNGLLTNYSTDWDD